ncbi:hypothetical protein V6Z11_A12G060900 [Gossypium hirsutum]
MEDVEIEELGVGVIGVDGCGRIDEAIQVRSNVDPTFYSLVGFGWSGGTTMTPLLSIIHISLINIASFIHGGIVLFQPFFHVFPESLKKVAIDRIFLTLHS